MPRLTLAERLDKEKRRKAKAAQTEATLLKLQDNERIRRRIVLSDLAGQAGIDALPPEALYACFLRIAKEAADKKKVAAWSRDGGRRLRRAPAKNEIK